MSRISRDGDEPTLLSSCRTGAADNLKILLCALLAVTLGCGDSGATVWARGAAGFTPSGSIRIERVGSGLNRPVYVTAPTGDARLFVVEQAGVIRVIKDGVVLPRP